MGKRKVLSEANLSDMLTPGPGHMYGTVKNLLCYDRVLVEGADGVTRVCRIRGKMKRRVWIKMNDTVLVAPWDFQTERADIMFRYTAGQVSMNVEDWEASALHEIVARIEAEASA